MSTQLLTPLEPFPQFVDSEEPSPSYFSKRDILQLLNKSSASQLRNSRTSAMTRLANHVRQQVADKLRLRYYQYELTFGLYIMTPGEKLVVNLTLLVTFTTLVSAMYIGLQPFLVRSICQLIYYLTGSLSGVEDVCSGTTCS